MRLTIGLDVDGVLADFKTPWIKVFEEVTGKKFPEENHSTWDLFGLVDRERDKKAIYERCHEPRWCSDLSVYPGAKDGVRRLREVADVIAVTSPMNGPHWMHERTSWLVTHFGFKSKEIIHCSAKKFIAVNLLIDDREENLHSWVEYQREHSNPFRLLGGVLWSQSYNEAWDKDRNGSDLIRSNDWDHIAWLIK